MVCPQILQLHVPGLPAGPCLRLCSTSGGRCSIVAAARPRGDSREEAAAAAGGMLRAGAGS